MRLRYLFILFSLAVMILTWGYVNAAADPVLQRTIITSGNWPGDQRSIRIAFLADIHAAEPGATSEHIADIVEIVNNQRPDVILLGGDFVSTKQISWSHPDFTAAVAPLAGLKTPLGIYAVLGNHDHWRDAEEGKRTIESIGITVLDNDALQVGPLALGGVDDAFTDNANVPGTIMAMKRLEGVKVLLSHSPDVMPEANGAELVLAGHTHCGQVAIPFYGPIVTMSRFGNRYACGRIEEDGRTLIVSAGTGTSLLPIRFNAPPDIWIIDVEGR